MTSLDFLFIALGIGAIVITVFVSVLVLYLVLILRDVSKVVENVKIASDKVNFYIMEPFRMVEEFVGKFGWAAKIFEKVKEEFIDEEDEAEEKEKVKFKVKKMK